MSEQQEPDLRSRISKAMRPAAEAISKLTDKQIETALQPVLDRLAELERRVSELEKDRPRQ